MEIINFIMALLVACGVGSALCNGFGLYEHQKYFDFPFRVIAKIIILLLLVVFGVLRLAFTVFVTLVDLADVLTYKKKEQINASEFNT